MKTINRTVIVTTPNKPYIDWANSFGDGGVTLEPNSVNQSAYLIPDEYDEFNYENFLKKNFNLIFEEELNAWMTDPNAWPQDRDYKTFLDWFDIRACDTVIDLGEKPLEIEEF
jgi:hypothetical protein